MDYQEFRVVSPADGKEYQCRFRMIATAISLRHSDTVDIKFLVNGKPYVVALPHAALAQYRKTTGKILTDADSIEMAGRLLTETLQKEGLRDDRLLTATFDQTLQLAAALRSVSPLDQPGIVGQ